MAGMGFRDRTEAGRLLAKRLEHLRGPDTVVLGLPRGGVPVAAQVATALDAPLDVLLVRKVGLPSHPELAMGAIGEGGVLVVNDDLVRAAGVSTQQFQGVVDRERGELTRRAALYRGDRGRLALKDKVALIVDDGVATGSTASAACEVARQLGARRVVLATPVGPTSAQTEMGRIADEVVFLETPPSFDAVGRWYRDFSPTSDDEVVNVLRPKEATTVSGPGGGAGS
jgi:putative phosphoribosyl transferase